MEKGCDHDELLDHTKGHGLASSGLYVHLLLPCESKRKLKTSLLALSEL